MKQSINFTQFCDKFQNMGRQDQFTYEGKRALFDHLEEMEEQCNCEYELDVIALCCEYAEYSDLEELFNEYSNLFSGEYEELYEEYILDQFCGRTIVIPVTGGGYIIEQF